MKSLMCLCFALVVFHSTNVSAGIIVDNSTTDIFGGPAPTITGITGINVLGSSYNVTLNDQITDWSDSGVATEFDWAFAYAASVALLDIFETGYLSGTYYDLNPSSAFGCSDYGSCTWLTLVGRNLTGGSRDARGFAFYNRIDDVYGDESSRWGASTSADYNTSYNDVTFLTWESSQPVPEPSTVFLLGSGLAGLAWYGRKRKKA